jgi:HD-GYP domain-containing protein (c-di-GMP phosphodiesterase class II)
MRSLRALLGPLLGSLVVLALFLVLSESPNLDPHLDAPRFHFWVVSGTSLLAFVLALVVGVVGVRACDARVVFLGAGLAGLGAFFALHGLATPGFLIGASSALEVAGNSYGGYGGAGGYGGYGAGIGQPPAGPPPSTVMAVAAQLSVLSLAAWMFAAAYMRPAEEGAPLGKLLAAWAGVLTAAIVIGLTRPEWASFVPVDQDPLRWGMTAVVLLLMAPAGARFLEGYRLSRSALHLVMLYVVGWIVVTQLIMVLGEVYQLSWWLYHLLLLIAVLTMLATVARQMQAGKLTSALGALLSDDAERRLSYGLRPEVRALVVATEARDRYTGGHMLRVAAHAVRLGRVLSLGPDELRALAQAAVVHDVGKIEVPDAVLNKPGRLDENEFALVRKHPDAGMRIGEALGMLRTELQIIRHHHERWDGGGYPGGLAGEAIPLLARLLAVADVYDALTSDRSYRAAWSGERAIAHIEQESGTAFDPACAGALRQALSGDVATAPDEGSHGRQRTKTRRLGTSGAG